MYIDDVESVPKKTPYILVIRQCCTAQCSKIEKSAISTMCLGGCTITSKAKINVF